MGFVVRALNDLDYKWVYGYDVSEWAIQYGLENGIVQSNVRLTSTKSHIIGSPGDDVTPRWDLTLALDVLEHLCQSELDEFIDELNTDYLLVRIPLAVNDGGKFVLTVSENDPTHITRLTRESWMQIFNTRYIHLFNINLCLMYDTSGVMCAMFKQRHDNV